MEAAVVTGLVVVVITVLMCYTNVMVDIKAAIGFGIITVYWCGYVCTNCFLRCCGQFIKY